jgi:hypothetical protein
MPAAAPARPATLPAPAKREYKRPAERFRVALTTEHIEQGQRGDAYRDAVCLAVYDALGDRIAPESLAELAVIANRSYVGVRFRKATYNPYGQKAEAKLTDRIDNEKDPTTLRWAKVPDYLSDWYELYDAGAPVGAIDFDLVFE